MIIIGYPGVGKTTAAKKYNNVIDLDISNTIDVETYCRIAEKLSKDGYTVCVNSKAPVQEFFMCSTEQVYAVYPIKSIKFYWTQHLRNRYISEDTDKNLNAYKRVVSCFDDDIDMLSNRGFINIELTDSMFLSDVFYSSHETSDVNNEENDDEENNVANDDEKNIMKENDEDEYNETEKTLKNEISGS